MKKTLSLFTILLMGFCFGQDYSFDYQLKASNQRNVGKKTYYYMSYDMINSKNHSVFMEINQNTESKEFNSILIDHKNFVSHRFDLGKNLQAPMSFFYNNSFLFSNQKTMIPLDNLKIEKLGDLYYRMYNTPKKKKDNFEVTIVLEPFKDDLIFLEFEPLTIAQQLELEKLLKDQLKKEGLEGYYSIKEITFNYFKNSVYTKKIKPLPASVNIDLSKVKLEYKD